MRAQNTEPATAEPVKISSPVSVRVQPLRDAGGLPEVANGQTVHERLTRALETYLHDAADGRYSVSKRDAPASPDAAPALIQFDIEGELSHVENNDIEGGSYLCALRLFKNGKPRRLIGQWAGTAISLRYLTGNLRSLPDVDNAGLVGEVGKRLIQQITLNSSPDQTATLLELAGAATERPAVKLLIDGKPPTATGGDATRGSKAQVSINSPAAGTVYLVLLDTRGAAHAILVPETGQETKIDVGRDVIVPTKEQAHAVDAAHGQAQTIVVLVRKEPKAGTVAQPRLVENTTPAPSGPEIAPTPNRPLPVRILDAGSTRPAKVDPAVARLLALVKSDPTGQWLVQRIDFKLAATP